MLLRAEVEIHDHDDSATVVDAATGLKLVVSHEIASQLARLRADNDVRSASDEPTGLLQFFRTLGMTSDATPAQARAQQARYILADAEFSELPRVMQTVERAHRQTALHREHLAQALQSGHWDLESLPVLSKAALRRHFPRGLTIDTLDLGALLREGDLMVASTSGTTGERLQVYSDTRVRRLPDNFVSLWGLSDLPTDRPLRTAVLTSPGCSAGVCTRRSMSMQERISFEHTLFLESARDPFELERTQVSRMLDELHVFQPDLLLVNPVYLSLFTAHAERAGLALPRVRAIVMTYQGSSAAQRARLAEAYGVPIFQMYSATELGGSQIGVSCRHGALHVRLDHVFLELMRDGERVEPGTLGNPVVTTHHPSMPLVRYRLSDLARFSMEPCACEVGSAWPSLILEGRERDAFVRSGELITSAMVDRALAGLPLSLYQLSEPLPGEFQLAVVPELDPEVAWSDVRSRLSTLLRPSRLELLFTSRLPLEDSGKFRFTVPYAEPPHV